MIKERPFVLQQLVMTGIEPVDFRERKITAEQIRDGRVIEPMPMQPPFRAWIDEAIQRQREQHMIPARALAAGGQAITPEGVQLELSPQLATQPARAPLTRTTQRHLRELDAHDGQIIRMQSIRRMLIWEERHLLRRIVILSEQIDGLAPGRLLDAIDLAEIQDVPLNDPVVSKPTIFDNTPVAVLLAIFESF